MTLPPTLRAAALGAWLATAGVAWGAAPDPGSAPAAVAYRSAAALQEQGLFDLAAEEWRALLRDHAADPLAPSARYNLGVCLFEGGDYARAAEAFTPLAEPGAPAELAEQALANLGASLFNAAQAPGAPKRKATLRRAVETFDRLLRDHPRGDQAPGGAFYRAEALAALGEADAASAGYRRALDAGLKGDLRARATLGLAALQVEADPAAAVRLLDRLIADGGDRPEARRLRGDARLAAKQYGEAADDFAAASRAAGYADADYAAERHAYALFQAGRRAEAARAYDALAERFPASPLAAAAPLAAAKCLFLSDDPAGALARLEKLWRADPSGRNAEAAHWLAQSHLRAGRAAEAERIARQGLDARPEAAWAEPLALDHADALYAQPARRKEAADAYERLAGSTRDKALAPRALYLASHAALQADDPPRALRLAERLLRDYPRSEHAGAARQVQAECAWAAGRRDEAIEAYRRLAREGAGEPRQAAALRLAELLVAERRWDEAAELLRAESPGLSGARRGAARRLLGRATLALGDPQGAATLAEAALNDGPNPEALLLLADARAAGDDPAGAIDALNKLLEAQPEGPLTPRATYQRGRLLLQRKDPRGEADLRRVADHYPLSDVAPFALYELAAGRFAAGELRGAVEAADALLTGFLTGPLGEARMLKATALERLGEHQRALDALEGAKASQAQLAYLRGLCLGGLGRAAEASAALKPFTDRWRDDPVADRALVELAYLHERRGDAARGAELFAEVAERFPDSPLAGEAALRAGRAALTAGRRDEARRWFARVADGPGRPEGVAEQALALLGWAEFEDGRYAQALDAFERQTRRSPRGKLAGEGRLMAGECLVKLERWDEAAAAFDDGLKQDARPEVRAQALLHAAQCAGQRGKWDEGLRLLDRFRAEHDGHELAGLAEYERAWALTNLGKPDEARPLFARLADSDPGLAGARARFMLGETQMAAKEYETAVRTFFRVAYGYGGDTAPKEFHAWQAESLFEAARCLEQVDRHEAAEKLYTELLARFPESEKAEHARVRLRQASLR